MGNKSTKILKQQKIITKNNKEIEDIYCMYDQTIQAVRTSKYLQSSLSNYSSSSSANTSTYQSKISNIDSVVQQLLEPFKMKTDYNWGKDIYKKFIKHFKDNFEEVWSINKEEFYKNLMGKCRFQTIDLQKSLNELKHNIQVYGNGNPNEEDLPMRQSYEQYFYEVGAAKIEEKMSASLMKEQFMWEGLRTKEQESKIDNVGLNLCAINASIISDDFQSNMFEEMDYQTPQKKYKKEVFQGDNEEFLPLFVNNSNKKVRMSNSIQGKQERMNSHSFSEKIKLSRIQNASIISPQTVFFDKMTKQTKAEISDLVKFYREFANTLQQMFFSSTSIVSAPYKHFMFVLIQKIKRKNLVNKNNQLNKSYLKKELIFDESKEGFEYRARRQFNNNMLLEQIRSFAQAYTDFIWLFLELDQICESKVGALINIYTLYGIAVKSVWKYVQWIVQRGFQYEEAKLQEYYRHSPLPRHAKIDQEKKFYLMNILMTLCGQKNPQKYLKKIVVFYRQTTIVCTCADDLLNIYEQLLVTLIKNGFSQQIAIFRMPLIIEKLLKLQESISNYGEISYSWTSWQIIIEILKEKIKNETLKEMPDVNLERTYSNMVTEPDWEEVHIDD